MPFLGHRTACRLVISDPVCPNMEAEEMKAQTHHLPPPAREPHEGWRRTRIAAPRRSEMYVPFSPQPIAAPAHKRSTPMKTLLLNKQDVGRLISMKEVIGTVEEAYKAYNS